MNTTTTIATRATADGTHVKLWSDGALTWALGIYIPGSARPRTPEARALALRAGWLVLGDVALYDADEVPLLVRAARASAAAGEDPGAMRARFARAGAPKMAGAWTVLATDRDGKAVERAWRFPRLSPYAGLAVWQIRGRYVVMQHVGGDTYSPTGFDEATLAAAFAAVRTITGVA